MEDDTGAPRKLKGLRTGVDEDMSRLDGDFEQICGRDLRRLLEKVACSINDRLRSEPAAYVAPHPIRLNHKACGIAPEDRDAVLLFGTAADVLETSGLKDFLDAHGCDILFVSPTKAIPLTRVGSGGYGRARPA